MKKVICLLLLISLVSCCLCSCGKTYTYSWCGKETKTVYYDAFDPANPDVYMCDECAAKYYSPLPYRNYTVNP